MEIRLLGTSAAEGFPALFCTCTYCQKARKLGGKNIRSRTSAVIDSNLKIDFPPDSFMHMVREGEEIMPFQHLLITHTHHDHFYIDDLVMRTPIFAQNLKNKLTIYGNETAVKMCHSKLGDLSDYFRIVQLEAFRTYEIDGAHITPLIADHKKDEQCLLYFIEKDKKTILYGLDTGLFPSSTQEWLKNQVIDVAILDCTNGLIDEKTNHMNIDAVKEIKASFEDAGIFHVNSKVVATHFSHNTGLMHEDLKNLLNPDQIHVAYDGMVITA